MTNMNDSSEEKGSAMISRKSFLQTLGSAVALSQAPLFAAGSAPQKSQPASQSKSQPKMSVSLYSYNGDLQLGNMNMEDCLLDLEDMGVEGVEFLPDALVPNYPNPPKQWVDQWFRLLEKYKLKQSACDCAADTKLYATKAISAQQIADMIIRDLKLANMLGFKVYRGLGSSWPAALGPKGSIYDSGVTHLQIYDRILPAAEKYQIKIGEELHVPFYFRASEWFDQTMDYIEKKKIKNLGFVPDMSIYSKMSAGSRMGGGMAQADPKQANQPEDLLKIMPYIFHIHGKCRNILEDLSDDASISYSSVIPVLAKAGYPNYISTEYEGERTPLLASHQVRRHQLMVRRMWAAAV
jgi:hypothetical protein